MKSNVVDNDAVALKVMDRGRRLLRERRSLGNSYSDDADEKNGDSDGGAVRGSFRKGATDKEKAASLHDGKGYSFRDNAYNKWKKYMLEYEAHFCRGEVQFEDFVGWLSSWHYVSIDPEAMQMVKRIWESLYDDECGNGDFEASDDSKDYAPEEHHEERLDRIYSQRVNRKSNRNVDTNSDSKFGAHSRGQGRSRGSRRQLKIFFCEKAGNNRSGSSSVAIDSSGVEPLMACSVQSDGDSKVRSDERDENLTKLNVSGFLDLECDDNADDGKGDLDIDGRTASKGGGDGEVEEAKGSFFSTFLDLDGPSTVSRGDDSEGESNAKDDDAKMDFSFDNEEGSKRRQFGPSVFRGRRDAESKRRRASEQQQGKEEEFKSLHCSESALSQFLDCSPASPINVDEGNYKSTNEVRVIVVGAGITGLTAAQYLVQQNFQVTVLESRLRVGGRIHSIRLNDSAIELGALYVQGINGNPIADIAVQLGLNFEICDPGSIPVYDAAGNAIPEWLYDQMRPFLNSIFNYLKTNNISDDYLAETQRLFRKDVCESLIDFIKPPDNYKETFDWVESSTNFYEFLKNYAIKTNSEEPNRATPRARKIRTKNVKTSNNLTVKDETQNVDVDDCEHEGSFIKVHRWMNQFFQLVDWHLSLFQIWDTIVCPSPAFLSNSQSYKFDGSNCSFSQGLDHVVHNISLGLDIRLGAKVEEIDYAPNNDRSDPVSIKYIDPHGVKRIIQGDAVILAVPLGTLKEELIQFKPKLPKEKRESLSRLKIGALNRIVLLFEVVFWDPKVPFFGAFDAGGSLIFSNFCPSTRQPVLTVTTSGKNAIEMEKMSDEQITQKIFGILKGIFKEAQRPKVILTSRWHQDPHSLGAYSFPSNDSSWQDYDWLALPLSNKIYFAGEYTHSKHFGTIHGAYESGIREAKRLMALLCGMDETEESLNTVLTNVTTVDEDIPPMVVDLPWRAENPWNPNSTNVDCQKPLLHSIKIQLQMD